MLLEVPVSTRLSWVTLERGKLEVDGHCLLLRQEDGEIEIPPSAFAALLLEPGVSVTHEAVKLSAENQTLLMWIGEGGTRLYSAGLARANAARILRQAKLHGSDELRIEAARRMYFKMFGDWPPPSYSIEKLRGIEGARVKRWYAEACESLGLEWLGKEAKDANSLASLPSAMAYANGCLYALSEIAVIIVGYSPAIGVVHSGDARSFVFDVADTLKFNGFLMEVMRDFKLTQRSDYGSVKRFCRDYFRANNSIQQAIDNMEFIFNGNDCGDS